MAFVFSHLKVDITWNICCCINKNYFQEELTNINDVYGEQLPKNNQLLSFVLQLNIFNMYIRYM